MNKLFRILSFFATAGTLSCCTGVGYVVTGSDSPTDGATVYLVDQSNLERIDSTIVSSGTFRMRGKAEKNAFLAVSVDGIEDNITFCRSGQFPFFNDGKPIRVNVAEGTLTGSALNMKLMECLQRNQEAYDEYNSLIAAFESLSQEEAEARAEEFATQYRAAIRKYADFYVGLVDENVESLIPVAFVEHLASVVSAADDWDKAAGEKKLADVLAANPQVAKHPYVTDLNRRMADSDARRRQRAELRRSYVGQPFRDLVESDPDGTPHSLDEYVGQGRWVLVNFWASWCGFCKAEIPNLQSAYKKYHHKGFDIVALSMDDDKDAWVKAIADWGMPWVHLSDLKGNESVAVGVYSVSGLPDNILIDPEGTIVARGLFGEDVETRLAEIFE